MQVAYNAKYNSGCISRQVGAVVTDQSFIVKSIGWNDVAKNQMPCKLRKLDDLVFDRRTDIFSDYERNKDATNSITKEQINFKSKAKELYEKADTDNLNGRHCAFCFKTLQNSLEGEKNQVHTRSLHAEENAMMQIAKKGGNGLEEGKLFTTASPCELCSKKAFQLGIKEIYYIDPYPGIARDHTLKNGIKSEEHNPEMIMFRGAVGRAYHKLYEPFMSYKDEVKILTGYAPQIETNVLSKEHVMALRDNKKLKEEVEEFINQKQKDD
jgi:deoxycytidylate deaminase